METFKCEKGHSLFVSFLRINIAGDLLAQYQVSSIKTLENL